MIERHFLGWDEPLLPLTARFLRSRYLRDGVLDLRNVFIVPPGGRAGRRLAELLLDEATAHAARLVPPRMVRTGDLAELFRHSNTRTARSFALRRVWTTVLREAGPEVVEPLFGPSPADDDVVGWDRIARRLSSLHREVASGAHTFLDVAAICESSSELLYNDGDRWRLLEELAARYRRRLRSLDLTDVDVERVDRVRASLSRADSLGPEATSSEPEVWLVGVTELPRVVAAIVERAGSQVGVLIHAPTEEAAGFDALGLVVTSVWRERPLDISDEVVRVADFPGDQAAAALDTLAELGEVRTGDVVIGVPDTTLVPYLRDWLESARIPVHYAGGRTLDRTRPVRLLEALAGYLETGGWEEFAALRRHPDVERWLSRKEGGGLLEHGPARLDEVFSDHLPARVDGGRDRKGRSREAGWKVDGIPQRGVSPEVRELVRPLESSASIRALRHRRTRQLSEWPRLILDALIEVYDTVPLGGRQPPAGVNEGFASGRRPPVGHELGDVLEKIRGAALELHNLPSELSPACDAATAIRLLIGEVRSATVPDDLGDAPIELLGWLDAVIDDAPHLIVVGVNEGKLPESSTRDAFLPDQLRSLLGIANDSSRYARDAFHLVANMRSRRSIRLIAGRREAAGDPCRPSRLLLTDRGPALAQRIRSLTAEATGRATRPAPILSLAATTSAFALPPEPILTFTPPTRFNVTGIRGLLRDPYRFVLENILGLESKDDEARELDALAFGSIAHEVLGRFGLSADRDSTDGALIARRLDEYLDHAVTRKYSQTFPAVWLQLEQLRVRLHAFASWQAGRAADGWRIMVVEGAPVTGRSGSDDPGENEAARGDADSRPGAVEIQFEVDDEPIRLRGRIDRIDHHPELGWAIFDYKTGNSVEKPEASHLTRGEWVDAQLPLYRHLARALRDADGEPLRLDGEIVSLGYIAIPREVHRVGERIAKWTEADLDGADEAVRRAVRTLRQGRVAFAGKPGTSGWTDAFDALLGNRLLSSTDDSGAGTDTGATESGE